MGNCEEALMQLKQVLGKKNKEELRILKGERNFENLSGPYRRGR
jgi:hypothetical protein